MRLPKVTCICPTFGRAPDFIGLLQETIYWFTRQDYIGPKELLVLNDCKDQTLVCRSPGVRVVNVFEKYPTLGEKYDTMVEMSDGDIILPWEDDDISLPGRISQAVSRVCPKSSPYFNPQKTWYEQGGVLHKDHNHGVCHNASAYTRDAWKLSGGYGPHTGNQDAVFDHRLKTRVPNGNKFQPLSNNSAEWTYVYRWGVSPNHLSGFTDMTRAYQEAPATPGYVIIVPAMGRDYAAECARLSA